MNVLLIARFTKSEINTENYSKLQHALIKIIKHYKEEGAYKKDPFLEGADHEEPLNGIIK